MKIQVITKYYREEFLVPLFMLHYETWVDEITLLTQKFPDGKIDDDILTQWMNEAIQRSNADWIVLVDMDEFVFPLPLGTDPRATLQSESADIIMSRMVRVWRHRDDKDIDRLKTPLLQRVHGEPDHAKPCIFRPKGFSIGVGVHTSSQPADAKWGKDWSGAHWANADPEFGIERRLRDRAGRLSDKNLANGWGVHAQDERLAEVYANHRNDPVVIS